MVFWMDEMRDCSFGHRVDWELKFEFVDCGCVSTFVLFMLKE